MRYITTYKSLMLFLFLGLVFQFQELQASNDKWYVVEGTTVVGKKHLAQTQKQATSIFVAKGATISGVNHFSYKLLQESTYVIIKPNTKLSNWDQVFRLGVKTQNTASLAVVQDPNSASADVGAPNKATRTLQKNKVVTASLPQHPYDVPQQPTLITATATVSFQTQKTYKNVQAILAAHKIINCVNQLSGLQLKTCNQNRTLQLQWRSQHTNRPPPFC